MGRGVIEGSLIGSNIKVLQSGEINMTTNSVDVTISQIDVSKSIAVITYTGGSGSKISLFSTIKIVNSTTITIERGGSLNSNKVCWKVIEYKNVKTTQKGSKLISFDSGSFFDVPISAINTNKSICQHYIRVTNDSTEIERMFFTSKFINNTNIRFERQSASGYIMYLEWQVIEFK